MATHTVNILNFKFDPDEVSIAPGDSVTWTNQDTDVHTATSTPGANFEIKTGLINPGEDASVTFDKVSSGEVADYFCEVHPGMTAKVIVS